MLICSAFSANSSLTIEASRNNCCSTEEQALAAKPGRSQQQGSSQLFKTLNELTAQDYQAIQKTSYAQLSHAAHITAVLMQHDW